MSGITVGTALAITGAVGAAGSIAGGVIGANAAGHAADTQASAADYAAQLQHEDAQAALKFQEQQYNTGQQEGAPWLSAGASGLANLEYLMGTLNPNATYTLPGGKTGTLESLVNPGIGAAGSLSQPFSEQFVAPTGATEQNDPGYQFRLQEGMKALQNSAAASGTLFSGGTGKGLEEFGQNYASNEYGNVYNRAMQQYQNRYNIYQQNQTNLYNRLAGLSGTGQQAAQMLNASGQSAANNIGNIELTSGQQIGQQINNAAAARASGYIGSANAWGGALSNSTNGLMNLYMMNQMMNSGNNPYSASSLANYPIPDPGVYQ